MTSQNKTGPGIDQSAGRSFAERLKDLGLELGSFVEKLWKDRKKLFIDDPVNGPDEIYGKLYSEGGVKKYGRKKLAAFLTSLFKIAGKHPVDPQGWEYKEKITDYTPSSLAKALGGTLWTEFYFVMSGTKGTVKTRVYVNSPDPDASLEVMKAIIAEYGKNKGLVYTKVCGPGCDRPDKIVAYLTDATSAQALVDVLSKLAKKSPKLFEDSLPKVVKRCDRGIGTGDEPPQAAIVKGGEGRHSFGTFHSAIAWLALKTTPKLLTDDADPRHLIDNIVYTLRLLEVDPKKPEKFPAVKKIEDWFDKSFPK